MTENPSYEGWVAVFTANTDYEADLVRDRLDEAGIPAVVLTQRDHVLNLTVGDLAPVRVMVPPDQEAAAQAVVGEAPPSDSELEAAALSADPNAGDAHDPQEEVALDSGAEHLDLSIPEESERAAEEDEGAPA
ncbi:MAG TPA: DUF2007 domain-containing protein [Rubricoccaceae bacterium]|nr:DUF2007 domain-containing protein [Rubricoccaceae bacterium]